MIAGLVENDGEHISYDQNTFTWCFKVKHFTRYGAGGEDEDSRDSSSNVNQKSDDDMSEVNEKSLEHRMDIDELSAICGNNDIFETHHRVKKPLIKMDSDHNSSQLAFKSKKGDEQFVSQLVDVSEISQNEKAFSKSVVTAQKKNQELMQKIQDRQKLFN